MLTRRNCLRNTISLDISFFFVFGADHDSHLTAYNVYAQVVALRKTKNNVVLLSAMDYQLVGSRSYMLFIK